jgi:competence protein ComEA
MESPDHGPDSVPRWKPWLRRADQGVVGALVLVGIVALVGHWLLQAAQHGRMLDIEALPQRTAAFQVDVNQAPWPELAQLPGIGETLAKRIVELRETDGPFVDHGDLERVRGIGPKTLEGMKPYLLPMPRNEAVAGPEMSPEVRSYENPSPCRLLRCVRNRICSLRRHLCSVLVFRGPAPSDDGRPALDPCQLIP